MSFLVFLINFTLILILPGYFLAGLIFRKQEFTLPEIIPISFCFSVGISIIPGILAYLFPFPPLHAVYMTFFIIFFLALVKIAGGKQKSGSISNEGRESPEKKFLPIFFIILLVTSFILLFYTGAYITADSWGYIASIRKQLLLPSLAISDPYYYLPHGNDLPWTTYKIWHFTIASIAAMSKIDILQIWNYLPCILVPIGILSFLMFAKTLFRNKNLAYFLTILFILYHGVFKGMLIWRVSAFNSMIVRLIFIPVILTFFFRFLLTSKTKVLVVYLVLSLILLSTHALYFTMLLISVTSFLIFFALFKWKDRSTGKRILLAVALLLLVASPYLYFASKAPPQPRTSFLEQEKVVLSENLYYVKPTMVFSPYPPLIPKKIDIFNLSSFILFPLLLFYVKKHDWAIFLFSNMLVPASMLLNPISVPLLNRAFSILLMARFAQVMPFILVLGFFLYKMLSYLDARLSQLARRRFSLELKGKLFISLTLAVISIFLIHPHFNIRLAEVIKEDRSTVRYQWERDRELIPVLRYVQENIPGTGAILADEFVSMRIPAFSVHTVFAVWEAYGYLPSAEQKRREKDLNEFFDPHTANEETISFLRKYNIEYVLLDLTRLPHLWKLKISRYKPLFREIYNKNNFVLYKVNYLEEKANE